MKHNNLFQQMSDISKASAYDIIVKQRNELLALNKELVSRIERDKVLISTISGPYYEARNEAIVDINDILKKAKLQSL